MFTLLKKCDIRQWDEKCYAELAFVLYFSLSFWRAVFGKTLSFFGLEIYGLLCATILAYIPLVIACIKNPRKYIKLDAVVLYAAVIIFFLVSYLLHPENRYWFIREEYGAMEYVFLLRNGLYAYMFVRLIDKPEDYVRLMKIAAVLMYIYFFYEILLALERGYWEGVAGQDAEAKLSYSVSFGYNVLFFALPFLYDAVKKHRIFDIIMAFIGVKMVFDYGSRGGMFCLVGFLIIVLITHIIENREIKKILLAYIIGFVIFMVCSSAWNWATTIVYSFVDGNAVQSGEVLANKESDRTEASIDELSSGEILADKESDNTISANSASNSSEKDVVESGESIANKESNGTEAANSNSSSRTMDMIKSGKILADNGRKRIWGAAIEMIKENPWGYGAMGSQPVISEIIVAGYPHNLLLDLWIDFGVIFGTMIAALFAGASIDILFRKKNGWGTCFICAFCCACCLFISLTFWAARPFWVTLGIVVNYYFKEKILFSFVKKG